VSPSARIDRIVTGRNGVSDENRWWADETLRAHFFDWDPRDGWYRRFFDIDDLAAVRVEDPEVFAVTHEKVLELVREGVVDGLRVDHPDGLADPAGYLRRLAAAGVEHVWVEKILHPGEALRDWPVEGTVGYEFLNDAAALFVDPAGEAALTDLFAALTGETRTFDEVALEAQVQQATTTFAREELRPRVMTGGCSSRRSVSPMRPCLRAATTRAWRSRPSAYGTRPRWSRWMCITPWPTGSCLIRHAGIGSPPV